MGTLEIETDAYCELVMVTVPQVPSFSFLDVSRQQIGEAEVGPALIDALLK